MRLLQILAPKPEPARGPQWMMRRPMWIRIGTARSKVGMGPPTRKERVPALAPATPMFFFGFGD
jgi:hypothetical protein